MGWFDFGRPNVARWEARREVGRLIAALSHADSGIQRAAAAALGRVAIPGAIDPLLSYYRTTSRNRTAHALVAIGEIASRHPGEGAVRAAMTTIFAELGEAVTCRHTGMLELDVRLAQASGAVRAYVSLDPGFVLEACVSETLPIARGAQHAMRFVDARAVPALVAALDTPGIAPFAAQALGRLNAGEHAAAVFAAFKAGRASGEAVRALAEMKDARAVEAAIAYFEPPGGTFASYDAGDADVHLVEALARLGPPAASALVKARRGQPAGRVRAAATAALRRLDADDQTALVEDLHHPNRDVRHGALRDLKGLGWVPRTPTDQLLVALTTMDWEHLRAVCAKDPQGLAALIRRIEPDNLQLAAEFGDASGLTSLLSRWRAGGEYPNAIDHGDHVSALAAAIKGTLQRDASRVPLEDLRALSALADRLVPVYATRDGEIHHAFAPGERLVDMSEVRRLALKELERREH